MKKSKDEIFLIDLGNRIKGARLQNNMTQKKLADMCGSDKACISKMENGKSNITIQTLKCVADVLDVSVRNLLK